MRSERLWVTWENQRRSVELAKRLVCDLHVLDSSGLFRYPVCVFRTLRLLWEKRPGILFVQNPSMVLAALACLVGRLSRTKVVVDRHSTFRLNKPASRSPRVAAFMAASRFTIRNADLTIVTNPHLAEIVRSQGGKPFVLPDPLPTLSPTENRAEARGFSVLFISSFGSDEPLEEVMEGARMLQEEEVQVYVTGNQKKADPELVRSAPPNVVFTGFLSEQEFVDRLFSADAVMVLTTGDYVMLCGCYEAVSAGKPLITSRKGVLEAYFTGATFVENRRDSIAEGIRAVRGGYPSAQENSLRLREKLLQMDSKALAELEALLHSEWESAAPPPTRRSAGGTRPEKPA